MSADRPTPTETTDEISQLESRAKHKKAQISERINAHDQHLKGQLLYKFQISLKDVREVLFFKTKDTSAESYYGFHPDMGPVELKGSIAKDLPNKGFHTTMEEMLREAKPEFAAPEPLVKVKGNRIDNWERAWRESAENTEKQLKKESLKAENDLLDQAASVGRNIFPDSMMPTPIPTETYFDHTSHTLTETPTATPTRTFIPTATDTHTLTSTETPRETPTGTATPIPTGTNTPDQPSS